MMQKKPRLTLAFATLLALPVLSCATTPRTDTGAASATASQQPAGSASGAGSVTSTDLPLATLGDPLLLTESMRGGLTGLGLESQETQDMLRKEARALIALRKGQLAQAERRRRVDECQADEPEDGYKAAFCRLTLKAAGVSRKPRKAKAKGASKHLTTQKLVRALHAGQVEAFAEATDGQVIDALKKIPNSARIRPMIDRALSTGFCAPTPLLTGLGLKAEENFPDTDWKDLTMALYQRAGECGNDASAIKGLYRLGLMQVWDQSWEQAEASFARIADHADAADFRSRVLYWRYFVAGKRGDAQLRDRLKAELGKDHPMSLHGLITAGAKAMAVTPPRVAYSSTRKPGLNPAVRIAELLQAEGAPELSIDALQPLVEQLRQAEPEFQLYAGLLLTRSGDTLNKFKLLSGLFRDYPGLIARESLEMLFPLQRFEIVRSYESQADPYLMISLIRQESAFNTRARSRVGAMGLMQLMPQTARRMERVSKSALYDPKTNIRLGVRFFSLLTERFNGEVEHALAAYNAGPEKVDTWKARYPVDNRLLFVDLIPFRETREYVASIARNYYFYKRLYAVEGVALPASAGAAAPDGTEPEARSRVPASLPEKASSPFKLFDT